MKSSINAQGKTEVSFAGKLVSPISEARFKNSNSTEYALASIEATLGGAKKVITAMIYSKNLAHGVTVGTTYSCKAVFINGLDQDPLIQMSHLATAGRASAADFAAAFAEVSEVPVETVK